MSNGKLFQVSKKQMDFAQAKAITKLDRKVKKLVRTSKVDLHYLDTAQTLTPGTTAALGYLTAIPQGNTENDRDGDAVSLKHLRVSMTLVPNTAAASDSFRIIFFRYRGDRGGAAPSVTNILQTSSNIDAPYNRDYRNSYKILYDRKIDCSDQNGVKHLIINKSLNNVACTFTGPLSTNYNENHVWFIFLATENANKAALNYWSRVVFSP